MSMMEAKRKLDEWYANPPIPSMDVCLDTWAKPLLWSMKFSGLFFDARHFPEAKHQLADKFGKDKTPENQQCGNLINGGSQVQTDASAASVQTAEAIVESGMDTTTDQEGKEAATDEEEKETAVDQGDGDDIDNFVPSLLRHSSGIVDEEELMKVLSPSYQGGNDSKNAKAVTVIDQHNTALKPTTSSSGCSSPLKCLRRQGLRIYAIFICCVLWGNCVRTLTLIGDPRLTWPSCSGAYLFHLKVALNSLVLVVSCWRGSHFNAFFLNWQLLLADLTSRRLGLTGVNGHTNMKLMIGILCLLVVVNVSFMSYLALSGTVAGGAEVIVSVDGKSSTHSVVLTVLLCAYGSFAWVTVVMFIFVICRHISANFDHFTDVLMLHIEAAGGHIPTHFRELRERHLVMCKLTVVMDKYVKHSLAVIFSTNIVTSCILMYQAILDDLQVTAYATLSFWIGSNLFNTFLITYMVSKVNISMQSPMYLLQTLKTNHITPDQQTQLQLFLNKLNGGDLGFTVLGMIMVKKELFFTLFGLVLTYAVVLIQFK